MLRHSGATNARVSFRIQDDTCELTISDNGKGTSGDAPSGMGLSNMRERTALLPDGLFDFTSGLDGTTVSVRFANKESRTA